MISIVIINNDPRLVCLLCLVCLLFSTAPTRCYAAALQATNYRTSYGVCCFFVDACRLRWRLLSSMLAVAVAVVLSVNMESRTYKILFADRSKQKIRPSSPNLGDMRAVVENVTKNKPGLASRQGN